MRNRGFDEKIFAGRLLGTLIILVLCPLGLQAAGTIDPPPKNSNQTIKINEKILNCQKPLGHHLYYREFHCPVGGQKFNSLVLGTHTTFGRFLDWEPISYMSFPPPVPVCPSNGFVMGKENYTKPELDTLKNVIESEEYKRVYSEKHASFYLFAKQKEALGEWDDEQWWFLLQATWEASQCENIQRYKQYANEAIKYGKNLLQGKNKNDHIYWVLNLVIPNLYRRLGEFEKARVWLEGVGTEFPKGEGEDTFKLAFKLLRDAVVQNKSLQIQIKEPGNEEKWF